MLLLRRRRLRLLLLCFFFLSLEYINKYFIIIQAFMHRLFLVTSLECQCVCERAHALVSIKRLCEGIFPGFETYRAICRHSAVCHSIWMEFAALRLHNRFQSLQMGWFCYRLLWIPTTDPLDQGMEGRFSFINSPHLDSFWLPLYVGNVFVEGVRLIFYYYFVDPINQNLTKCTATVLLAESCRYVKPRRALVSV